VIGEGNDTTDVRETSRGADESVQAGRLLRFSAQYRYDLAGSGWVGANG